jgi:uncharacterized protein YjiS (DUF1127 family)
MRTARQLLLAVDAAAAVTACDGRLERAPAERPAAGAAVDAGDESEPTVAEDAAGAAFSSEAERTRAMEAQAEELRQRYEAAMADAATEEEKLRAYQEFEQGRQELDQMSEGDLGDGEDAYPPPPES